jgi:hypothetical protein
MQPFFNENYNHNWILYLKVEILVKQMMLELQFSDPLSLIMLSLLTHVSPFHVLKRLYLCKAFKSFLTDKIK